MSGLSGGRGAALLLIACGGGSQSTDIKRVPLAQRGTFPAVFCAEMPADDDGKLYSVTLRSYSACGPKSWLVPDAGCRGQYSGNGWPARYGLSKDLTMLAAIGDDRAIVYDMNTG